MSLRRRLVAAIVVVGAVLVIAGVAVAGLIRGALIDQVDQQLERATPPLGVFIGAFEAGVAVGPTDVLGPGPGGEGETGSPSCTSLSDRPKACACSGRPTGRTRHPTSSR